VKEVFYRVYYSPQSDADSGRYVIDKVFADFVMSSGASSEQKFGIEFIASSPETVINAKTNTP